VFVVADQMPQRGFSAKARIYLCSFSAQSCEARVVAEIRPVGKNLTNQLAVHKAFVLVLDEMKKRYGVEKKGLLGVFIDDYNSLPEYGGQNGTSSLVRSSGSPGRRSHHQNTLSQSPKSPSKSSITSFKDVLTSKSQGENPTIARPVPVTRSPNSRTSNNNASAAPNITKVPINPNQLSPRRHQHNPQQNQQYTSPSRIRQVERPSTPSMRQIDSRTIGLPKVALAIA